MSKEDYEFLCSKCNSKLSIDISSQRYIVIVDMCDKCLEAEREDGHYDGYLERDEEAFQEAGYRYAVNADDMDDLRRIITTRLYKQLDTSDAVYLDVISDSVKESIRIYFYEVRRGKQ